MRDKVVYMFMLMVLGLVGITYRDVSVGLAVRTANGPFYCHELKSSGGDDTAMVFAFSLFFMPLVVRLFRLSRDVSITEVGLFYVISALTIFSLFLATLDCAEIFYTAFGIPDPYLAIAIITLPCSALFLWKTRSS